MIAIHDFGIETIHKNMAGPEILKSKLSSGLTMIDRNKSSGPDVIIIMMVSFLDDFSIAKIISKNIIKK